MYKGFDRHRCETMRFEFPGIQGASGAQIPRLEKWGVSPLLMA